jgi:hypothetical protein
MDDDTDLLQYSYVCSTVFVTILLGLYLTPHPEGVSTQLP